jgi:uncharacterized protein (TIGR02444 family)
VDRREQGNSEEGCGAAAERLWQFATSHYAREAVAHACLRAQDALGMDVNLLLFSVWRAAEGETVTPETLAAADAAGKPWREAVLLPLRARRRAWKHSAPGGFEYAAIKQLELRAEQAQLAMLAGFAGSAASAPPSDARTRLADTIAALCAHYAVADDALNALQAALLEA